MLHRALIALAILTSPLNSLHAQWSYVQEANLVDPGLGSAAGFGQSVAIDGTTAVVGAGQGTSQNPGRATVFVRSGGVWTQQQVLLASDGSADDQFGVAVDIDGDTIVVGAQADDPGNVFGAGSAYVFVRNGTTWTQQQKLTPPSPTGSDAFGCAVAISGDTLVVGALGETHILSSVGGAHVFTRTGATWALQASLTQSLIHSSRYGTSVALDGNSLLVGAPIHYNGPGTPLGAAFSYQRVGAAWSFLQELVPGDPDGDRFGVSVALESTRAVVGADSFHIGTITQIGAAYVFDLAGGSWVQQQRLDGIGLDSTDWFGTSVGLSEQRIVVGAPGDMNSLGVGCGTVKLFEFDGSQWIERLDLLGGGAGTGDALGTGVAIDGDIVLGGASNGLTTTGLSGEAYAWRIDPPVVETYCTAKTNSLGCLPLIAASGTASVTSASPFLVSAALERNQKLGLLFYGLAPNAAPFQGGWLCVHPPTIRLPTQSSAGSALPADDCTGTYSYNFNARIQSGVDLALVAGEDVYCQWWSRDPGAVSNTGLTDGLRMRIQP